MGLVSLVTQPESASVAPMTPAASSLKFMTSPHAPSLRRFLVIVVFLPEPLLELRIRLFLGGLAQATRHDVVVAAAGLGATAAATTAARGLAALVAAGVGVTARLAGRAIGLAGRARIARGSQVALAAARSATGIALSRAIAAGAFTFCAAGVLGVAFLGDALLFFFQRLVEVAE